MCVRERDRHRERERERERERRERRERDGGEVTRVALKLATNLPFLLPKFVL